MTTTRAEEIIIHAVSFDMQILFILSIIRDVPV